MARRRLLISCATVLLAAGCSAPLPKGADGDLGNNWPAVAAPKPYEPKVGTCLDVSGDLDAAAKDRLQDEAVSCTERHDVQVAGAGTLGPDGATNEELTKDYRECDKMARAFLHEDWRNGRLEIRVVHAKTAKEADGARWWECVLVPQTGGDYGSATPTTLDLAGGIPKDLRLGCQTVKATTSEITDTTEVDCAKPHHAEYAGAIVFPVGTRFPESDASWRVIHNGCRTLVAKYVGTAESKVWFYSSPMRNKDAWSGLRDVRCYVYTYPKTTTGSAKGRHGKGMPW
ncbi:hypothetical protein Cs7R123_01400 [Catellatospora sp. TT07R-123]|uniref:septum formation family protein n=1 Tax=Catellatospora sp. TT07R-123 TaxID=2733863 RepID=UPI001B22DBE5|nr:septum formation family protein [Catellatospora sp. TT07R-123]GHJ42798.1 hypothetical protein Cs7R123_01400 [Catellatospora sp. TT07R-123]